MLESPQQAYRPSSQEIRRTSRSALRRVNDGRVSKSRQQVLLENLELELNERTRKLRSQYTQQSHALKQRIEMRITRVPKKLWKMTMAELLAQTEGKSVVGSLDNFGGAKSFVDDIRRLSHGETNKGKAERLVVKKKSPKRPTTTTREKMPPPPIVMSPNPLRTSTKSNLPSSSSPVRLSSPQRSGSPVKLPPKAGRTRRGPSLSSNATSYRPVSRATTRSSTETAAVSSSVRTQRAKNSPTKTKASPSAGASPNNTTGLKRGGVKGTGSNGSLKENRVAGVKKDKAIKAANAGRVLRSRK